VAPTATRYRRVAKAGGHSVLRVVAEPIDVRRFMGESVDGFHSSIALDVAEKTGNKNDGGQMNELENENR